MADFSKKNTKESGGKFAGKEWNVTDASWVEEHKGTEGFNGIFYRMNVTDAVGNDEVIDTLLGDADALKKRGAGGGFVTEDGTFEDNDDDNPYEPRKNDPTSQLFNSMEEAGVPMRILQKISSEPKGVVGYTFKFADKPTGKMRVDKKTGREYPQTWLVVAADGLIASPDDSKKSKSKPATSAAAAAKAKAKAKAQEEEESEEESEESSEDPIELAAVATVQEVLANPKKFVLTYNAKKNGGGVDATQMSQAALGNAIPYKALAEAHDTTAEKMKAAVSKPAVQKLIKSKAFGNKFNGELWIYDEDAGAGGVYSVLDE